MRNGERYKDHEVWETRDPALRAAGWRYWIRRVATVYAEAQAPQFGSMDAALAEIDRRDRAITRKR